VSNGEHAARDDQRMAQARELARRHHEIERGLTEVFLLRDTATAIADPPDAIKLLEVNENTVTAGIVPIGFSPAPKSGIHFPSVIVEVTPDEFRKIEWKELQLPNGWEIGERIWPPMVE